MAATYFYSLLSLLVILSYFLPQSTGHNTPPIFILGDSTADVGTNTYLRDANIQAKADFPHNGIDFPNSRPTGRFSNGFNSADHLAKLMGLKRSPPPYLFLLNQKHGRLHRHISRGVNFASGGAGLLDITGSQLKVLSLSSQISHFATVRNELASHIGNVSTEAILKKSLFFISVGGNDILGYFLTNSTAPKEKFIDLLMLSYANHIERLYKLGARKFGIISVPPVGCCPSQRLVYKIATGKDGCFDAMNDFAISFHSALDGLLYSMSSQLPGMIYSLGNGYKMTIDVINNPDLFKFENVDAACCGLGYLNAQSMCNQTASVCADRRKYLFWDLFHPTQKAARLAAETLYGGPLIYVSPINFSQLTQL